MSIRTGDVAQNARLNSLMQSNQSRAREAQLDISTGKRAHRFSEVSDQTAVLLRAKEDKSALSVLAKQNAASLNRMQAIDSALGQIADQMIHMRGLMTQRLNDPNGDLVAIDTEVDIMLDTAAAALNVKSGDRYLLGGSRSDAPPIVLPANVASAADLTGAYRGDDVPTSFRMDREVTVDLDLNAGQFQGLLETLAAAKEAHLADDRPALEAANDRLSAEIDALAQRHGQVGATMARMENIADGQRATIDYLGQIESDIEDTDIATAMANLAQDKVMIEATYLTISRINSLSLVDYIR